MFVKSRKRKRKSPLGEMRFVKFITLIIICHGMFLSSLSYILSFTDHDPVASVSEVIVREIIAPAGIYIITNLVSNIFEKNKLSFSTPINQQPESELPSEPDSPM